jgi:hypothetical protein
LSFARAEKLNKTPKNAVKATLADVFIACIAIDFIV